MTSAIKSPVEVVYNSSENQFHATQYAKAGWCLETFARFQLQSPPNVWPLSAGEWPKDSDLLMKAKVYYELAAQDLRKSITWLDMQIIKAGQLNSEPISAAKCFELLKDLGHSIHTFSPGMLSHAGHCYENLIHVEGKRILSWPLKPNLWKTQLEVHEILVLSGAYYSLELEILSRATERINRLNKEASTESV